MAQSDEPKDARGDASPESEGRLPPEEDAYAPEPGATEGAPLAVDRPAPAAPPAPPSTPTSKKDSDGEDDEEEHMLRMSFLEHLEELRKRIIRALMGIAVAFAICVFYSYEIWDAVREPAAAALKQLHFPTNLAQITPTEAFSIIWVKLPILAALFLASPWVLYQAWAFIAPGLYKRERRMAVPFIASTAGLFILGGVFAYFVAFRFGLVFLLGIGGQHGVQPMIQMTEYTDLFVNVMLGVALIFELPVLIFFLTLLHLASPRFLLRHSRYAILFIVIAAAIITPTPDVYNLTIFAVPMILLYFVGVFASYLLVLRREGKSFPWGKVAIWALVVLAVFAVGIYMAMSVYHYKLIQMWPFLVKQ